VSRPRIAAVIPARMAASRYPGKPLVPIAGIPMVEMVRRRVALSPFVDDVIVATPDQGVFDAINGFGGRALMTADTHERCTDRVQEAAGHLDAEIVVMVQGDEPLFDPMVIERLVLPLIEDPSLQVTNLLSVIGSEEDLADEDVVKTVLDVSGFCIYYSRAAIPFRRVRSSETPLLRQTGLSAFRRPFLDEFSGLPPTPLEIAESVDFLRIVEHGRRVLGVVWDGQMYGVDRPDDVAVVSRVLLEDPQQAALHRRIV
jgi:3-deoxy-manno-octulosonate cytidylyltransferase (CMP-KDO synthetase)